MAESFTLRRLSALVALALVIFALCYGAGVLFTGAAAVAAVWPANALVLAFKLRACPTRLCGRVALAVAFTAMVAANLAVGRPLVAAIGFPVANVIEIALAAWFMRRIAMPMVEMRDLGQFLLGAVLAAPLASTLIAAGLMAATLGLSGAALVEQAGAWLLADAMGMAIVAPFALSLGATERSGWARALVLPAGIGVAVFALSFQAQIPVLMLSFPLVALAVFKDRDRGGALSVGAVTLGITAAALMGQGPLVRAVVLGLDPVAMCQVFLATLVLTAYPISVALKRLDLYAARLDDRRQLAEAESAAKSRVLGRVGEDLRSPLTGVVTVAEMLRSGRLGELNPRQLELLARIAEGGAEIEALTHEMTAVADGAPDIRRPVSVVAEVVAQAASGARFRARRAGVGIEVVTGLTEARAAVDPARLKRLIADGLSSALAAAPRGSVVRVEVAQDGPGLVVTVQDAGADTLNDRLAAFAAATLDPSLLPLGADRLDLRRRGGDLRLVAGELGGACLRLRLPGVAHEGRSAA